MLLGLRSMNVVGWWLGHSDKSSSSAPPVLVGQTPVPSRLAVHLDMYDNVMDIKNAHVECKHVMMRD